MPNGPEFSAWSLGQTALRPVCGPSCPTQFAMMLGKATAPQHKEIIIVPNCLVACHGGKDSAGIQCQARVRHLDPCLSEFLSPQLYSVGKRHWLESGGGLRLASLANQQLF